MTPITFVAFKWKSPTGYRSTFLPEHVRTLKAMIARHYAAPHRFCCVTDDASGLDGVETIQLWPDHALIPNPNGANNPSCYRRLKLFSADARERFGDRIVCMDLDTVIVGDLRPLFDRPEDFIVWGQTDFPRKHWFNGSLWYLKTGTRTKVWTEFDPKVSPSIAKASGAKGSDQGWLSYILGRQEATWDTKDGVYSWRVHVAPKGGQLPADARVVCFHGQTDPWSYRAQQFSWIREHYREAA